MHIRIISDSICPWCFIGKRRLERALSARPNLGSKIEWLPFQLNPNTPITGLDREFYLRAKFGTDEQVKKMLEKLRVTGLKDNIPFLFHKIKKVPNTLLSHRLINWSHQFGMQNKVVEQIFLSYFRDGKDIGDINVLIDISEASGLNHQETKIHLSCREEYSDTSKKIDEARRLGITAVPCFIFNGQYALYGAHEPETLYKVFDLLATNNND